MRNFRTLVRPLALLAATGIAGAALATSTPAIISEGGANAFWRQVTPTAIPPFPAHAPDASEDVCVSVGYLIKADGTTSDFALVKTWTSKHPKGIPPGDAYAGFTQGAVASVMQRRFVPAQLSAANAGASPVFTAASFAFSQRADADVQALRAHCVVDDLPGFVANVQNAARAGRKSLRHAEEDRNRAQYTPNVSN